MTSIENVHVVSEKAEMDRLAEMEVEACSEELGREGVVLDCMKMRFGDVETIKSLSGHVISPRCDLGV